MTTDSIKELVKRLAAGRTLLLRADGDRDLGFQSNITTDTSMALADELKSAIDALEAMAGEVERLTTNGIHSCWEECPRLPCAQGREIRALIAERDRLKAALSKKLSAKARQKLGDFSESMIAMGDGHSLEMLLNWYDESRKALGGDAS